MFNNIPYNEIISSKLNSEIKNINFQNYDYNYLKTDFILDTKFLFPISIKTNQTSTDLFSHFYYKKYKHFFMKEYYEFVKSNLDKFQSFSESFVIGSHNNYYHLVIDILPRIFGYNKITNKYIKNIIFTESKLEKNSIIKSLFEKKKIEKEVIILKKGTYKFNNSLFTLRQNLQNVIKNYRDTFAENLNNVPKKNIYISRADAKQRKILNEVELINNLKKLNFEIINLSDLNFIEQMTLFNSSKCIVALHGAGLTNLIFCNKKTSVIEIFPDFTNSNNDWYSLGKQNNQVLNMIRPHYLKISQVNNLDHTLYFATNKIQNKINKKNFDMNEHEKMIMSLTTVDIKVDINKLCMLIKKKTNL